MWSTKHSRGSWGRERRDLFRHGEVGWLPGGLQPLGCVPFRLSDVRSILNLGAGRRCLVPKWTESPRRLLGFVRGTWQLATASFAETFKQSCWGFLTVSSTNTRAWNTGPVIEETRFRTNLTHLAIDSEVRSSVIDTPSPIISRSGTW
jgi:hypothetical protein